MSSLEQELLRKYAEDGDPDAFRALFERHRDMVFSVCRRQLRNSVDAEDAAQNCFLEMARRAHTLKAPIAGWLHRVALRAPINLFRQNQSRMTREALAAHLNKESGVPSWNDLREALDEAVDELPERLRAPIVMRYLEGRTQEEVAGELGISQSAVSKRLSVALETLRKRFAKTGLVVTGAALGGLLSANAVEAASPTFATASGKLALAGTVGGKAVVTGAMTGGISVLKLSVASVIAAGVLAAGGFGIHEALSAKAPSTGPQAAAQQPSPQFSPAAPDLAASGQVLLPDGQVAPFARIRLLYAHDTSGYGSGWLADVTADMNGRFSLAAKENHAPDLFIGQPVVKTYLLAMQAGYAPAFTELIPGATGAYTLRLSKGVACEWTITDENKQPVIGADVWMSPMAAPWTTQPSRQYAVWTGTTDAKGVAVIRDVLPAEVSMAVIAKDRMTWRFLDLRPDPNWKNDGSPENPFQDIISLPPNAIVVRGMVVGSDTKKPLKGKLVVGDVQSLSTRTDGEGRFEIAVPMSAGALERLRQKHDAILAVYDEDNQYAPYWVDAADWDSTKETTVTLSPGLAAWVSVRNNLANDEVVPGAIVAATVVRANHEETLYRRCNVNGRCLFRFVQEAASVRCYACPGYIMPRASSGTEIDLRQQAPSATVQVDAIPDSVLMAAVSAPDGSRAVGATVRVFSGGDMLATAQTDAAGLARVAGIPQDRRGLVYAVNGNLAAMANVEVDKGKENVSLAIKLQPARIGTVELRSANGQMLRRDCGILVKLLRPGEPPVPIGEWNHPFGEMPFFVPGLIPGQEYIVEAKTSEWRQLTPEALMHWRIRENDTTPTLVVQFEDPAAARSEAQTQQDFAEAITSMKDVAWKKPDPVQLQLTWYGLKHGFAIADTRRRVLTRTTELLGEIDFVVSAIAFGRDKVWLGTNKGLFAWDRQDMFWTRFAVGGDVIDAPVKKLSLTDAGKLLVTVEQDGKPHKFEYDTRSMGWHEIP